MAKNQETFEKHKLVIDEWFVNGWNGTKAYMSQYPNASYNTADKGWRDIHDNPRIQEYIQEKKESALHSLKTSHEALLKELENWAYSDITETLNLDLEQVKELPPEVRRLITSYKKSETRFGKDNENIKTTVELKFVSKEKAMEMIHKHVGFYGEHNKQKQADVKTEINYKGLSKEALEEIANAEEEDSN